jgi:hypothetical protein
MSDPFRHEKVNRESPARNAAAVTTHNTNDLPVVARALWIGGEGDISVIMAGDDTPVTFRGVFGLVPFSVRRVRTTGTTATDIVAIW